MGLCRLTSAALKQGEEDVDAAIAACDGDMRAAIMALLVGQAFLEVLLEEARREASWSYVRGRPSRWGE